MNSMGVLEQTVFVILFLAGAVALFEFIRRGDPPGTL